MTIQEFTALPEFEPVKQAYFKAGIPFMPALERAYTKHEVDADTQQFINLVIAFMWMELKDCSKRPAKTVAGKILRRVVKRLEFRRWFKGN